MDTSNSYKFPLYVSKLKVSYNWSYMANATDLTYIYITEESHTYPPLADRIDSHA